MKIVFKIFAVIVLFLGISTIATAQNSIGEIIQGGEVHGNFQVDGQYYPDDNALGINDSVLNHKRFGLNGFGQFTYTNRNFTAGIRFETYLQPMVGFDAKYEGTGVPYWFASYQLSKFKVTVGHFYEQFGSGLILRSYEEWTLGYDNNIYGINVAFNPYKGVILKGLVGTQRYFWEPYENQNRGTVRGLDGDFMLNEIVDGLQESKARLTLGGSFVSKYENVPDLVLGSTSTTDTIFGDLPTDTLGTEVTTTTYNYNLPYNVSSWAARMNFDYGGFNFYSEYAQKGNDPSAMNRYIYKKGQALYSTMSYSQKGLGLFFGYKWIDNMSYKSKITELGTPPMLDINYLPATTPLHGYSLQNMYPYATQPLGEVGFQGQVVYTIPKKSAVGGKYGTTITVNYSRAQSIQKDSLPSGDRNPLGGCSGTDGYTTSIFSMGDLLYYQDLTISVERKLSKKIKVKGFYTNQTYNLHVIEDNIYDDHEMVYASIGVLDLTYKFSRKNSLRLELQGLWVNEKKGITDDGDWFAAMLEFNASPHWFVAVGDEYNYGNPFEEKQIHYFNIGFGYTDASNRISLRYGRTKEGLLCVGGVCRAVPQSSGLTLTITSSF